MANAPDSLTAAVLAPLGRDAALAAEYLGDAGIRAAVCAGFEQLCEQLRAGLGCALITEEALTVDRVCELAAIVAAQPPWSDLPILVFSSRPDALRLRVAGPLQELGNVSFIDRPVRRRTLIAAVRSALRARARQYDAERAIRSREQFLAMLGHELRNPLAAILLANDLLGRHHVADPVLAKYTEKVERQTRHLHRLVDDLLDVARVTSGKVVLKRGPVLLETLVCRCVELQQAMADTHGVGLTYLAPEQELTVDADAVRLEQVINNLVTNALKYTPRGGRVLVKAERDGDRAVVSVEDDGVGIAREHLDAIFDLFNQAPTTLDRARGGLGLGLTLVRALVELHGGAVSASSRGLGQGSRFEVRLPLAERQPSAEDASRAADATERGPVSRSRRILIVDDNVDIREVLVEVLRALECVVEEASDGPQGVARIVSWVPDVALIDIGLPGFDGYEVARRARQAVGDSVRLIALTGYGQTEDRAQALAAGFDLHLTKPLSFEEIAAAITDIHPRAAPDETRVAAGQR